MSPVCRVVLAHNLKRVPLSEDDRDAEFDPPETVDTIARSIEALGHEVVKIEATPDFPVALAETQADVVFNISECTGGRAREAYVPALCEMMGVAYTGSDATTLAVALDKSLTKTVLAGNGVPTPEFHVVRTMADVDECRLRFPVIVKPNEEGSSKGLLPQSVVTCAADLPQQVEGVLARYNQPVIVEECLLGREFTVGFLGTDRPEALPLLELEFLDPTRPPIYDLDLKQDPPDKIRHVCPAHVDETLAGQIVDVARSAYLALRCRDIGRVDVRLDQDGRPHVIEVNPLPGLAPRYSDVCKMTESLGWPHTRVIAAVLDPAIRRRP